MCQISTAFVVIDHWEMLPYQVKLESVVVVVEIVMFGQFFLGSEIKCLTTNEQTPLAKWL